MNFSYPAIRRPVGTTLLAIGLFLVGAVAYSLLPVASLPTVEIARGELEVGLGVLVAFAEKAKLVASNGEARRQIKASGLKVNDATVTDEKAVLTPRDVTAEGVIKLSLGKKRHVLLKPV